AAWLGHALDALDDRLAVLRVLQAHAQHASDAAGLHLEALHVALLLEDARDLRLEVGGGHLDLIPVRMKPIPHPSQEIGDRISHRHLVTSSTWSCRESCPRAGSRGRR